jgi:hypothetical protein
MRRMRTLAFEQTPLAMITVLGRSTIDDAEWDAYTEAITAGVAIGTPPNALVWTDGGAPSPSQRARLEKATAMATSAGRLKVAILTDSTFARGVTNAMSLINRGYRAFSPTQLDDALAYLDVRPGRTDEVRTVLERLRAQLQG